MSLKPIIEICCAGPDDVSAAIAGGASRIELCSALASEGVTPSYGMLVTSLRRAGKTPVTVLVRPREGDFHYSEAEVEAMIADIHAIRNAGAAGVTIGALTVDCMPDREVLMRLIDAAGPELELTFHRAIDDCADPVMAIDMLADMGIHRVLTSGGASDALHGVATIKAMIDHAAQRIEIMPGGGVRPDNIQTLRTLTGATQFHSSARNKISLSQNDNSIFGAAPANVDADIVSQLINTIN